MDLFGGFPSTPGGVSTGLLRLRTAHLALDWKNTSVFAGQTSPFFSPRSPTSIAEMSYPSFSYSGNLWAWTPQIAFEHGWDVSEKSRFSITSGVMDPLSGDVPRDEYERPPNAGERSRIPAYATRLGWDRKTYDGASGIGFGGYYSRQNWPEDHESECMGRNSRLGVATRPEGLVVQRNVPRQRDRRSRKWTK